MKRSKIMCAATTVLAVVVIIIATKNLASDETPPNVVIIGQVAEPTSLDPATVTSLNDFRIIVNLFDRLVRYRSGSLEIEPGLAASWRISQDGLTYTFRLRDGAKFHDGTPVDAEAVVFSLMRMIDPDHPYHDTTPSPLAFFFEPIESVQAVDAHTVRIRLTRSFAPLLSYLSHPAASIVSPSAVRKYGKAFGRHPVGSGPFRFDLWESRIRVVVSRNNDYWDGSPRSRVLVFRPILDHSTRLTEFLAGQIDVMLEVQPDEAAILERAGRFQVLNQLGAHLWYLIFNTRSGPFADVNLRRAVNCAIDKQALVERVLQATAVLAVGPLPAAFEWAYLPPDEGSASYDPERARALIKQADRLGAEVTVIVPQAGPGMLSPVAMVTAIQADLERVGLRVSIETMEWNSYLARVNSGLDEGEDMAAMAWIVADPDTLPYLTLHRRAWPENGGFNSGHYSNERVDRLIEAGRRATAQGVRARHYRELQRLVRNDVPWAPIASWTQTTAVQRNVRGLRLEPSFELRLNDIRKSAANDVEG